MEFPARAETEQPITPTPENNGLCVYMPEGRGLKVLQLADIHFGIEGKDWHNDKIDKELLSCGNVYSIDTPNTLLENEIKKRELWFELERFLKENNCLATNEDWKNEHIDKYYVLYNYKDEEYEVCWGWFNKKNDIFSTNEEVLENYMNTLSEEEIKIMFDIN